jgi:hypothetical protein
MQANTCQNGKINSEIALELMERSQIVATSLEQTPFWEKFSITSLRENTKTSWPNRLSANIDPLVVTPYALFVGKLPLNTNAIFTL